jgi:hypothetical protein
MPKLQLTAEQLQRVSSGEFIKLLPASGPGKAWRQNDDLSYEIIDTNELPIATELVGGK